MERFLIEKDSYIDITKDDVDGKTYIAIIIEPKKEFEPKDGDIITLDVSENGNFNDDCKTRKLIGILHGRLSSGDEGFPVYAGIDMGETLCINDKFGYQSDYIARPSSEEEKQKLLNMLADNGQYWNPNKKCIEDIPRRKFKAGDKVQIKAGVSSKTHSSISPAFVPRMDECIGKTMEVESYDEEGYIALVGQSWNFVEDWLELYKEEYIIGEWYFFYNNYKEKGVLRKLKDFYPITDSPTFPYPFKDNGDRFWKHAIPWNGTREQLEDLTRSSEY